MRFIVVLATIFSACCCLSILNIFSFHTTGPKSDLFYREKRTLLNNNLTDEEILRCKNFIFKIYKDLNQRSTEEISDILLQCSLFLQQNSELLRNRDQNYPIQSPALANNSSQEHDSMAEEHSSTESSNEATVKITGTETVEATPKSPEDHEDLQMISTVIIPKPTTKSSSLWSLLFWNEGSSSNTSSVSVQEQNEGNSTDKSEDRKTGLDKVILSSTSTSWSIWNYVFGASDSKNFSNEIRSDPIAKSGIYFENSTDLENSTTEIPIWNLVMPGTKWCGSGSTAENDDDLGYFEDVDRCCRAHDKCDDLMVPGETKNNLTNTSPFTVLNCKCDNELYDCLSQINSVASNTVGNTFFNIFGRMCYMLDYPRVCKKYYTLLGCLEYVIDETAEKVFQWKPAKKYLKMPFTISGR